MSHIYRHIYSTSSIDWRGQIVFEWAHQPAKHHRKTIILLNDPNQKQRNPFWLLEFICDEDLAMVLKMHTYGTFCISQSHTHLLLNKYFLNCLLSPNTPHAIVFLLLNYWMVRCHFGPVACFLVTPSTDLILKTKPCQLRFNLVLKLLFSNRSLEITTARCTAFYIVI